MIVLDPSEQDPNSPGERSTLKAEGLGPATASPAPPPPYISEPIPWPAAYVAAPTPMQSPAPVINYQSIPAVESRPILLQTPRSAFGRFLRAFGIALLILFLWGWFIDSMQMVVGNHSKRHRNSLFLPILWGTPSIPSPTRDVAFGSQETSVIRTLPIQWGQIERPLPSPPTTSGL